MIIKAEAEKGQVKQRTNAIHEVFDGLTKQWFIKEELDNYIALGGCSGYSIDEDNIITFRR